MRKAELSIGFFDSGVGGISVLKEAIKFMPNENYIYFGDSNNAPYGIKTVGEVQDLSFKAIEVLLSKGVKAIVVACNTATSAAIDELRDKYKEVPIIGMEPALKPAVELKGEGTIVIMATPMTLVEKKFKELQDKYSKEARITPLPCDGLVELIEAGKTAGEEVEDYLINKFKEIKGERIASIVLGCTHYPFVKDIISKVVGVEIPIIDGSEGTLKQLKRILEDGSMVNETIEKGRVQIYSSLKGENIISLCYDLLKR